MNTDCIMSYSPFELMYYGVRHTTVDKYVEDQNLTTEQIETLKEKLLVEENRVYDYWLQNLPHFAVFVSDKKDDKLHLSYNQYASSDNRLGADALTTIARDLIEKVGNPVETLDLKVFPVLRGYTEKLKLLIRDFNECAYDYDKVKVVESDSEDPEEEPEPRERKLFDLGYRATLSAATDLFWKHPMSFEELREIMTGLDRQYIAWLRTEIFKMNFEIGKLDKNAPDYEAKSKRIVTLCTHEIACSLFFSNLKDPKYRKQIEKYKEILSVECDCADLWEKVTELINTGNLWEILNGIWQNKD